MSVSGHSSDDDPEAAYEKAWIAMGKMSSEAAPSPGTEPEVRTPREDDASPSKPKRKSINERYEDAWSEYGKTTANTIAEPAEPPPAEAPYFQGTVEEAGRSAAESSYSALGAGSPEVAACSNVTMGGKRHVSFKMEPISSDGLKEPQSQPEPEPGAAGEPQANVFSRFMRNELFMLCCTSRNGPKATPVPESQSETPEPPEPLKSSSSMRSKPKVHFGNDDERVDV